MKRIRIPVISIVLYFFALLFVAFAIFSIYNSASYLSEIMQDGQLEFSGNEFDIISFFVSNNGSYIAYVLILFALGYFAQKCKCLSPGPEQCCKESGGYANPLDEAYADAVGDAYANNNNAAGQGGAAEPLKD